MVALFPQVGFALQSGLNVIPCFGEKLEEREAGRTMEVETLTFIFAFFKIMDYGGDGGHFSSSHFCLILKQCWVVHMYNVDHGQGGRNVFICLWVF